jgi:hypothetical protein
MSEAKTRVSKKYPLCSLKNFKSSNKKEEAIMSIKRFSALMLTLGLVLVLSAGFATTTLAAETKKDASKSDWWFHDIVDVDFVMQNISVPMKEGVMIIDSRPKRAKYDKGHIPGAVSIPDSEFDKATAQLPAGKDALLIFYCEGPT